MRVYLRRPEAPDLEVPRSLSLEMGGAASIGGIVRDEAGRPIGGASVKIAELTPPEGAREVFDASAVSTQTDIEGRWHFDVVPADLDLAQLQFGFTHPDFLTPFEIVTLPAAADTRATAQQDGGDGPDKGSHG